MRSGIRLAITIAGGLPAATLATFLCAVPAMAQDYPSRPISVVVPFAPGGGLDVIARLITPKMSEILGQRVVVENTPGAAGSVGVGRVVRSAPDGYTLSIGLWSTHVLNGAIYSLNYDVINDLEPIGLLSSTPQIIVVNNANPANDLKSFIAWLKANPTKATQATSGMGGAGHVAGVFFQKETGTNYRFVPYRGLGPATQAVVAGQVDFNIDVPSVSMPHVRAGKMKAFAITDKARLASAPDVPTVDEAGLPGFYAPIWYAMWAPKGTPAPVIAKLNAAIRETLADPKIRDRFVAVGHQIFPADQLTPQALGELQKADAKKWWPLIKAAKIQAK